MIQADKINASICLTDLDKSRFHTGKDGKQYLNFTISYRRIPDAYGNDLTMYYAKTKEQREAKEPTAYIKGNAKTYRYEPQAKPTVQDAVVIPPDDDLPF